MQRAVPVHRSEGKQQRTARFRLLIPQEHGSWGMLATVLLLPHLILGSSWPAALLAFSAVLLFFARRPVEILLHNGRKAWERRAARYWTYTLLPVGCGLAGLALMASGSPLPAYLLGMGGAGLIGTGTIWEHQGGRGSFWARALSMVGITLFVPLHAIVVRADIGSAWALSLMIFLFFLNSALRVRALIRARKIPWFRPLGLVSTAAFLILSLSLSLLTAELPTSAAITLLPTTLQTWRALLQPPKKTNVMRIGIGEIVHTIAFIALTGACWIAL